jgi:hypothetical protein
LSSVVTTLIAVSSVPALLGQTPDARAGHGVGPRGARRREETVSGAELRRHRPDRQIRGNNLVPIEFEINCELPDKFVRKDEIPAQDTDPTTRGFNGDTFDPGPAARRRARRSRGPVVRLPRSAARRRRTSRRSAASGGRGPEDHLCLPSSRSNRTSRG